jgi:radical SAM protein with 4Fe4S-binding SPASM domain
MTQEPSVVWRDLNREPLWQAQGPLLEHLDIELTERCNNACIHCCINLPQDDVQAQARELPTEAWKDILHQAADLGALSVRFTGGEPLLRADFPDLYLFARRLGLKVILFTNARLLTPSLVDLLARIPPLKRIEVTVYGMHQASYEAVTRAPGSYAEFRAGVQRLLERHVPFIVKGALLPPNKGEMEEFEAWAGTIPWMEGKPVYAMFLELRGRRDSEARNRMIAGLRASPAEGLSIMARQAEEYCREAAEFCGNFLGPPNDQLFTCGFGHKPCVDAYGMVQGCMTVRDPHLAYDLRSGSLHEALTVAFPRLDGLRATNPQYLARCAHCFLRGFCDQCPGQSWTEHGTLDTPVEYLCQVAHAEALYLGLLVEGERAWEVEDGNERVRKMNKGVKS